MSRNDLFKINLSVVDNIPLYKVDALIAKYIFNIDVKIFRYKSKAGIEFCKPVQKADTPESVPRYTYKTYVRQLKPFDQSKWKETKRYSTVPAYALELSKFYALYLTIDNSTVISTVWNRYQISGNFAEVVAQTVLLMYLCEKEINLKNEPLDEIFKEWTSL